MLANNQTPITVSGMNSTPYFYRPIGTSASKIWKCAGLVGDAAHRAFFTDYFAKTASPECALAPGVRIATHYLGDRVALVDLENNAG